MHPNIRQALVAAAVPSVAVLIVFGTPEVAIETFARKPHFSQFSDNL